MIAASPLGIKAEFGAEQSRFIPTAGAFRRKSRKILLICVDDPRFTTTFCLIYATLLMFMLLARLLCPPVGYIGFTPG